MLLNEKCKFSDREIIKKGTGEDYLKVQGDIYKDMSLDEIFEHASDTWQKDTPKQTL